MGGHYPTSNLPNQSPSNLILATLPNPRSTHPSTAHHGTLHPPAVPLGSHLPNHGPPRQWTPRHQVRVRRRSHCRRSSLEIRTRKRLGSCCRRSHLSCCHHHRQCVFPCCRSLDCCQRRVCDCSSDCPAIGCYEQQLCRFRIPIRQCRYRLDHQHQLGIRRRRVGHEEGSPQGNLQGSQHLLPVRHRR